MERNKETKKQRKKKIKQEMKEKYCLLNKVYFIILKFLF